VLDVVDVADDVELGLEDVRSLLTSTQYDRTRQFPQSSVMDGFQREKSAGLMANIQSRTSLHVSPS